MIQINNFNEQFARVAARAATANLTVEPSTLMRQYRVKSGENVYRVDFYRARAGRKFVTCDCQGGQNGYICKHMAAALPVHLQTRMSATRTKPNNGMHPTPLHAASHVRCAGARVMPGVRRQPLAKGHCLEWRSVKIVLWQTC